MKSLGIASEKLRVYYNLIQGLYPLLGGKHDLIFVKDADERFTLCNHATAALFNRTPLELIGKTDDDINPIRGEVRYFRRDDLAVLESGIRKIIPTEVITGSDGKTQMLRTIKVPVQDRNGTPVEVLGVSRIITSEVVGKKQVSLQAKHWEKLFVISKTAMAVVDANFNLLRVSPGFENLTASHSGALVGTNLLEWIHSAQKSEVKEELQLLFQSERNVELSFNLNSTTGKPTEVTMNAASVEEDEGSLLALVELHSSTLAKKVQELNRLRVMEQEIFLKYVPGHFYVKDLNNTILLVNSHVCDFFDLPREQIEGKDCSFLFPNDADRYYQGDLEVIRTGKPILNVLEKTVGPKGEIWTTTNKIPLHGPDGNIYRIMIFSHDVTEFVRIQKAYQESEKLFKFVFENSPIGIAVSNQKELTLTCNPYLEQMLGYRPGEMIDLQTEDIIHPDDLPEVRQQIKLVESGTLNSLNLEKRFLRRDRSIVWGRLHAALAVKQGESDASLISLIEDITDSREAQDLEAMHIRQTQELDRRNRELANYTLFLNQKNTVLGGIADGIRSVVPKISDPGVKQDLEKLVFDVEHNLHGEEGWRSFKMYFEQIHPHFFRDLLEDFPKLSQKDLRHCAFIRMNLSVKEIARLSLMTPKSVEVARYRLKKKIGLSAEASLSSYILEL